ncbi:hypothetical protein CRE_19208 [Caenorhabditis remanei]|uniref:Major facilitator superfamily (MFS) profile domain-containing protein n=1 Tax=Caenorhabditis remanei TaxID=31234 RepID=E3MJF4_CAERE|nr:hypothetical protein CRE_19208 [Caenorhabditis remanei]
MTTRRRPSMRTRMKVEDVSSWVEHNQQPPLHVRFEAPPAQDEDDNKTGSTDSLTEKPVPLDGGYGWVVVLCSFIMHAICDGASFCFGIVFVMIQKYFQASRVASILAASLFLSLPLIMSPMAGTTSDVLGCRMSIIIGGTICTVSSVISIFCTNIWAFTFFFGFGCGLGMSFIYNAAIVIVTYYFEEKRATATSMAVAGTGGGTFVFPMFLSLAVFLFQRFATELQAALIAFSIAYFIIVLIGLMIRDVEWDSDSREYKMRKFERNAKFLSEQQEDNANKKEPVLRRCNSLPNLRNFNCDIGSIQSICEVANAAGKVEMPARSKSVALFDNQPPMPTIPEYSMLNTRLANLEHLDLEYANSPCNTVRPQRKRVVSKTSMSVDHINELDDEDFKVNLFQSSSNSSGDDGESSSDDSEMSNDGDSSSSELSERQLDEPSTRLLDNAVSTVATRAASSAPTSARLIRNSLAPGNTSMSGGRVLASNAIQPRHPTNLLTMGKIPSAPMLVTRKKRKSFFRGQKSVVTRIKDVELPIYKEILENRAYRYFLVSVFFLYLILDVPYVCFYDYALEHFQLSENMASALYSVIGITNFCSTMLIGKTADIVSQKYVQFFYLGSMVGVSATLIAATFVMNGTQLIVCAGCFGLFVTSNYVLQSVLIVDAFNNDMNLFQNAYSFVSTLEGIASLIGPPIFAQIRELSGSYTLVFFIAGVVSLFSSVSFFFFIRETHNRDNKDEDLERGETNVSGEPRCQNGVGAQAEVETLLDV